MTFSLLQHQFKVGLITLLAGVLAAACIVAGMMAVHYDDRVFSNPMLILTLPQVNIAAARWSMLFDMLGYYILLLPAVYLFHDWLKNKTSWSNLVSFGGLAYVLVGSTGAAILAVVYPMVLEKFPAATPAVQETLKLQFEFFNAMVYNGLWNLLELIFAALWWCGLGLVLYRHKYFFTGILSLATGLSCIADAMAGMFEIPGLHVIALNAYLLLSIKWAVCTGLLMIRKQLQ